MATTDASIARQPRSATSERFDLVVIGGGILGAMTTLEAARRGLRPLLIERNDFGSGTSCHSLRIVHGGLRYLQSFDLPRFRQSLRERRWLLRHYPELVHPLRCLMPLYGEGLRRPPIFRAALSADRLFGFDRNRDVVASRHLPGGRLIDVGETLALFPAARRSGLLGAALWYDAAIPESEFLLIELLRWACAAGARALNYVEATGLSVEAGSVRGVHARDRTTGEALEFRTDRVINCAGPQSRALGAAFDRDVPALFRPSLAFNLLLDLPSPSDAAVAVNRPGGRIFFLHPWKGRILAGTYHAPWPPAPEIGSPDALRPPEELVQDFLEQLNDAIPGLDATRSRVLCIHAGLLPAKQDGTVDLASRAKLHDHGAAGGPRGLVSASGIKLTTARALAEQALHLAFARPLPAYGPVERPPLRLRPDAEAFILTARANRPSAAAYVHRLVQEEAILCAEDLMMRRTHWGMLPELAAPAAACVADLMGCAPPAVPTASGWPPPRPTRSDRVPC